MINKWILNNFKSINEEKELEFRPLTIFTGANSSGKSTILQSILLVTQTLQNQVSSKSIVLNGWFKKFGSYSDVVFAREHDRNIKIGFSISDVEDMQELIWMRRHMHMNMGMPLPPYPWEEEQSTDCEFVLSSNGKKDNLQPELESVQIRTIIDEKAQQNLLVSKELERSEIEQKVCDNLKGSFRNAELNYTIKADRWIMRSYRGAEMPWKVIGVKLNHFMPEYAIVYCTNAERLKVFLRYYLLMGERSLFELDEAEKQIVPLIAEKAMDIVEQLYAKNLVKGKNVEKNYANIKKKFTLRKLQAIFRSCALEEDERQKYITQITDKLNNLSEGYHVEPQPIRANGVESIRNFFKNRINYLGPLREEPKSLYPLGNDGSTTEVGLKGENTAAVYDNNQNEIVTYIDPRSFASLDTSKLEKRQGTLAEAVNKWLVYMGVANDVVTSDKGKIGHSMQISNDLDIKQDLTHVGVGVSQVLPILVMSLLSESGSVIILEQPELHLHPKVQTRLADFFVSLIATNKQCIIETHSEYMINRLRFLVAKSDNSKVADDTMIYFVEKEAGHSEYRPVTINKYGVIEDWPDGFFDESEKIAAEILRAGMEKHLQEEGDEEDDE